ncbi:MAG: hypothetical protein JW828_06315 [Sedimentisphaerales bacterium]|nr:hypothetical protein [Sedimentisphaerales bacterium]
MGAGSKQGVRRYIVRDVFGPVQQLTPIPGDLLYDPAGLALRSPDEVFVANRAAHTGNSSISRFALYGSELDFIGTFTGNGVTDCHQLCFDPVSGELFQTNWTTGILSRFVFDGENNPLANGILQMPDNDKQLGVVVRPADRQLFVSDYQKVRRFSHNLDGSYTFIEDFAQDGGALYHFMKIRDDILYLTDFNHGVVLRFTFDDFGAPIYKDSVAAEGAVDMDFSPDGQEMYVTDHRNGGIMRYRYDGETDTWIRHGDKIPTPMLGGIVVTTTVCPLAADLTGDCVVNYEDLMVFADQWLVTGDHDYCVLNANLAGEPCEVTVEDFGIFASQWLMEHTLSFN